MRRLLYEPIKEHQIVAWYVYGIVRQIYGNAFAMLSHLIEQRDRKRWYLVFMQI